MFWHETIQGGSSMIHWHRLDKSERIQAVKPLLAKGRTFLDIAEELHTSVSAISGFVARHLKEAPRRRAPGPVFIWTQYKRGRLRDLAKFGHTAREIADTLKAPYLHTVQRQARKMGIELVGSRRPKALGTAMPEREEIREDKRPETNSRMNSERAFIARLLSGPPVAKAVVLPPLPLLSPSGPPKPFIDRRMGFECAWILESASNDSIECCGAPTEFGMSWCEGHLAVVWGRH